ncbi:TIGR02099 family protein [Pseudomonas sp. UL073]|uniref:TIGR02099 family protein n=1 Tax=Zestomonas insulae TaxID=2809017 RepID=A0ABS2IFM4_9GAMM|nr:YhdP family protein [Pseudomonas insulae]MBM7061560.1 TIGR02099 family protein [Pseudomonas insulae]
MARGGAGLVALLRWAGALLALLLVLAALYVSLGRELMHWVADYRAEVESKAREATGLPLRIGSLEGSWHGFAPVIYVHDVELGEGDGLVRLERVQVVPDVLASLLERQPRLASLSLQGLHLGLKQNADGGWSLEGLPRRDGPFDLNQTLAQLKRIARISLLDSQFTVEALNAAPISFSYLNLSLRSGSRQRLDGRLVLPDGQPLAFNLRAKLDRRDWRASSAELYLSLPQSDWARWLPASLTKDWHLRQLQAGGEVWLNAAGGQLQRGVARLHAPQLAAGYAERKPAQAQNLSLDAYYERGRDGQKILLDSLAMSLGETRWGEVQIAIEEHPVEPDGPRWQVRADRLDLAPLLPLVAALAPLPEQAADYLAGLKPHGTLRNLLLDYRPQAEAAARVQLAANLDRLGISPYRDIPGVENVSGSVSGSLAQGELRILSDDFSLHLHHQFPKPWHYRTAAGRLTWRYDEQALTLALPYLQVSDDSGRMAADMLLRLMRDPAAEDYLDLRVGLRDGDARVTEQYLPTLVPTFSPELANWLKTAIRAGKVDEGFFQFQGSVVKDSEPAAHSISLFFKTHDALLAFQPGWPELREARGDVFVEDSGVRVALAEGRLLDSRVHDAQALVPHVEPGQTPRLQVDGAVDSSVVDALHILQEAPLGTAEVFAGWSGSGAVAGRLRLDIPLHKGDKPNVSVDFTVDGARLKLTNPALELSDVKGAFNYDTNKGLSAADIRAQAFGRPLRGKALASGSAGRPRSRIEANGQVALQSLTDWLALKRNLPLSGSLPYNLALTLDGANSDLAIDSNLKGLAIDLPAPFGKAAVDERATRWQMTLQGPERRYALDYAGLAKLAMAVPSGQPNNARGELLLGAGQPSIPSVPGLLVSGRIAELNADAWLDTVKRYAAGDKNTAKQFLRSAQLRIDRFHGFGADLADLSLRLARGNASWAVDLEQAQVKGRAVLPDSSVAPIVVNLEQLRLPAPDPQAVENPDAPDPLAKVDPRQIPPLDVHIGQLYRGERLFGAFALTARPTPQGVAFQNLNLDLKGLQVSGNAWWEGAPGQTRTRYVGRLQGKNLADVLKAWDFAPNVTSERFRLDADGQWPGSPAWVALKRFSGTLDASLRTGQFVEVEGGAQALRVFGLLNFNSISRRLRLDFSDLLGKGLSYDRVKGLLVGTNGVYVTREPIKLEGPSSNLELNGTLDMANDRMDARLLVTLPLTNNLPIAALIVGAPAVGGALFVVDKLLGDKVSRFASVQYNVRGPWKSPQITLAKPFEKSP